jgi:ABC-2 type transport system permease protein
MVSGYFDKLLLAPIHRLSVLLGALLMAATRALLQGVVVILIALGLGVDFQTGVVGIIALLIASAIFGLAWSCLGIIIALKSRSAQATQASFTLFFPFIFLTTAFTPKELISGWFEVAATINPVTYVMDGMRAMVITGWDWSEILTGLWVLLGLTVLLVGAATWLYRRQTA